MDFCSLFFCFFFIKSDEESRVALSRQGPFARCHREQSLPLFSFTTLKSLQTAGRCFQIRIGPFSDHRIQVKLLWPEFYIGDIVSFLILLHRAS